MSARLNLNQMPIMNWKGLTFQQLTPGLQKNTNSTILSKYNLKLAQPLKIYRKEIASTQLKACNQRNISIDDMNIPNGYSISNATVQNGLKSQVDFNYENNKTEHPGACASVCFSPAKNALNRVRSSGNLKKNYNINKNNDTYYTSTKQYLESRNQLFSQNQYNYFKSGDQTATAGSPLAKDNVYTAQGTKHCPKFHVSEVVTFEYQWANGWLIKDNTAPFYSNANGFFSSQYNPTTVTIPVGFYTVEEINQLFQATMVSQGHYYIKNSDGSKVFLMEIRRNSTSDKIELVARFTNNEIYSLLEYSIPAGYTSQYQIPINITGGILNQIGTQCPYYIMTDKSAALFGFAKIQQIPYSATLTISANDPRVLTEYFTKSQFAQYPSSLMDSENIFNPARVRGYWTNVDSLYTGLTGVTSSVFMSADTPQLISFKQFVPLYYKPNNSQYAQQGAVSSSSRITRLKYNTITTNAFKYQTSSLGSAVANALAYTGPENAYTLKDKLGYPKTCTPVIDKYTGNIRKC